MRIIVDECIAESTIQLLKQMGFEVVALDSILHWGVEDERIFKYAAKNQIPIITHDKDFGQIFYQFLQNPPRTIVVQVQTMHPEETNKLIKNCLNKIDLKSSKYQGKLILISRTKIRVRQQPFTEN